jgi:aminoglycoside phosphotransferase (APT) family kinase protein
MPDRGGAMTEGTRLMRELAARGVPLPALLAEETIGGFPFVLMQRLAGTDLGHVIGTLSEGQLKVIAAAVAAAQQATSGLGPGVRYGYASTNEQAPFLSWSEVLGAHLERSRQRLLSAALFDPAVLEPTASWLAASSEVLDRQPAIPFLHDTTTKNVIIDEGGRFSGIVDVDDLCFGDPRYAPALTLAVLKGYGGPARYVTYWLEAAGHVDDATFRLYVALFLLDLMAEHGQIFNGNERPSTPEARAGLLAALDAVVG